MSTGTHSGWKTAGITLFGLALGALGACDEQGPPAAGKTQPDDPCADRPDGVWCDEGEVLRCTEGVTEERERCGDDTVCHPNMGCVACTPGERDCEGNELRLCRLDASGWDVLETCEPDIQCTLAGCSDLCARAAEERSYIGCEYWPVTLANESLDGAFEPAVAVGNPNLSSAEVTLSRGDVSMTIEVAPGDIEVLPLPFDRQLKEPYARRSNGSDEADVSQPRSMLVRGGAYHLTSSSPVTVHQFNPLEFEAERCADPSNQDEDGCFSFTNDASLLLPTTAMTGNYVAITRPTLTVYGPVEQQRPGIVAIVGTQPEPTQVTVRVHAHVAPSSDDSSVVLEPLAPGDSLTVELAQGDVLQLASASAGTTCPGQSREDEVLEGLVYCDTGADYDLTGTEIEADAPVAVLAGHDCTFVPYDRWACDHLEESMFPVESWGSHLAVTRPARRESEAYRIKVVSATDDNRITVEPSLDREIILGRGESYEWESTNHVVVQGSAPISVAQFLIGQDNDASEPGDPSMSLAIPSDQYKRQYEILTPETYDEVYVNLVTAGEILRLDGREVGGLVEIGESGYRVVRQRIDSAGLHTVEGGSLVGVVVYGFAPFTSYMVPGGLDLNLLQDPPF